MTGITREHELQLEKKSIANNELSSLSSLSMRNSEASVHTVPSLEAAAVYFLQPSSSSSSLEQSTNTMSSLSQLSSINLSLLSLEATPQQILQLQSSQALSQSTHSSSSFQSIQSSPEILGSDNLIKEKRKRHHGDHDTQNTKATLNGKTENKKQKRRRKKENANDDHVKETNGVKETEEVSKPHNLRVNKRHKNEESELHNPSQGTCATMAAIKPLQAREHHSKVNESKDANESVTQCDTCTSSLLPSSSSLSSLITNDVYAEKQHMMLMTDAQPTHLHDDDNGNKIIVIEHSTMSFTGHTSEKHDVLFDPLKVYEERKEGNNNSKNTKEDNETITIGDTATNSESCASTHDTASSETMSTSQVQEITINKSNNTDVENKSKLITVSTYRTDTNISQEELKEKNVNVEIPAIGMSPEHIISSLNAHIDLMSQNSSLTVDTDSLPFVQRNVPVRSIHYIPNSQTSLFEIASSLLYNENEKEHHNNINHYAKEEKNKHKRKRTQQEYEEHHQRKKKHKEEQYKNNDSNTKNNNDVEENTPLLELFPLSMEEEEQLNVVHAKMETEMPVHENEEEVKEGINAAFFTENDEENESDVSDSEDYEVWLKKLKRESAHITHHGSTSCLFLVLPSSSSSSYSSSSSMLRNGTTVMQHTKEETRNAHRRNLYEWLRKWEPILIAWSQQTFQHSNNNSNNRDDVLINNTENECKNVDNVIEANNNKNSNDSTESKVQISFKQTKRVIICVVESLDDMYSVLLAYSSHVRALHAQLLPIFVTTVVKDNECHDEINNYGSKTTKWQHQEYLQNQWRLLKHVQWEFDLDLKNSFALMCSDHISRNKMNMLWSYFLKHTRVFNMSQCNKIVTHLKTHMINNECANMNMNTWHQLIFEQLCKWNILARELDKRACRPAIVINHTCLTQQIEEQENINKLNVFCGLVRPAVCHTELFTPTTSRERRLVAMQESAMVEYLPCVYVRFHRLLCQFFTPAVYFIAVNVVHTHGDDYFSGYSCQAVGFLQFEVSCLVRRYVKVELNINLQVLLGNHDTAVSSCNNSDGTITNVQWELEQPQEKSNEEVTDNVSKRGNNNTIIRCEDENMWQSLLPEFSCSCTPRNHEQVLYTSDGRKKCRHVAEVLYYFIQRQRYARNATL